VWEACNDATNDKGLLHPVRVAGTIKAYIDNIVTFCYKSKTAKRCDSSLVPHWIPPPPGLVCVNVDAAVFSGDNRMGWGAVIRDNNGVLKLSVAEGIDGITSPELAEAMAIRGALSTAFNNGFKDIILASDCLSSASTLQLWIVLLSALW
jgi:hypothetical protein